MKVLSIYVAGLLLLCTIAACQIVGATGCNHHASKAHNALCDWYAGGTKKQKKKKKGRKSRATNTAGESADSPAAEADAQEPESAVPAEPQEPAADLAAEPAHPVGAQEAAHAGAVGGTPDAGAVGPGQQFSTSSNVPQSNCDYCCTCNRVSQAPGKIFFTAHYEQ